MTASSTWAAAPAGTRSRCTAAAATWSPSTRTATSSPACWTVRRDARGGRGARRRRGRHQAGRRAVAAVRGREFDRVVASEVLEHIPADTDAIAELVPGAAARRHDGRDRAALAARADLLGAVGRVPRGRGRPRPHLHRRRAGRRSWRRRPGLRGPRPRPRAARAVLVAQVRGRRRQATSTRWSGPTTGCWCGTS